MEGLLSTGPTPSSLHYQQLFAPLTRGLEIHRLAVYIDLLMLRFAVCIDLLMLLFAVYIDLFEQPILKCCLNRSMQSASREIFKSLVEKDQKLLKRYFANILSQKKIQHSLSASTHCRWPYFIINIFCVTVPFRLLRQTWNYTGQINRLKEQTLNLFNSSFSYKWFVEQLWYKELFCYLDLNFSSKD